MKNDWQRLGSSAKLDGKIKCVQLGRRKIAFTELEGRIYAFDGLCPHVHGPMERSEINGTILTCPLHGWRFDIAQQGREIHDYRSLNMYETKVEGGDIYVRLPETLRKSLDF